MPKTPGVTSENQLLAGIPFCMSGAVLTVVGDSITKCLLCRNSPDLTFEHIPPKSCYNCDPRQVHTFDAMLKKHATGEKFPRGVGRRVLCGSCNSFIGNEYIKIEGGFKDWTHIGMELLNRGAGGVPFIHGYRVRAGAVGRQMVAMALAMTREQFADLDSINHLRRIVWNPQSCFDPGDFIFCVYLMGRGEVRLTHFGVPHLGLGFDPPVVHCEISMPPFGYVVFHRSDSAYRLIRQIGLCDISYFVSVPISSYSTEFLRLCRLVPIGAAPLDYEGVTTNEGMI